jgi:hypothetical protein
MIRRIALILSLTFAATLSSAAPTDDEVAARKAVLDLAGGFANDGFKLRDGHWTGPIKTGDAKIVQVNLYAGNEYYFSAAISEKGKKVTITIFDETGKPLQIDEPLEDGPRAAIGFSPSASGSYYVKVEEVEGEPSAFCLVCSYK